MIANLPFLMWGLHGSCPKSPFFANTNYHHLPAYQLWSKQNGYKTRTTSQRITLGYQSSIRIKHLRYQLLGCLVCPSLTTSWWYLCFRAWRNCTKQQNTKKNVEKRSDRQININRLRGGLRQHGNLETPQISRVIFRLAIFGLLTFLFPFSDEWLQQLQSKCG